MSGDEFSWMSELGFDLDGADWIERLREASDREPLGELGGYELLEEAGRGGQGVVYLARCGGNSVAVKRILSGPLASPARQRRFEREVEAVRMLDHPGIVRVLDAHSIRDAPVLVMEWIDGLPITEWSANSGQRRATPELVNVAIRVCDALDFAHQRGVVHRDLKPSNLLVDAAGAPHLLDFGLAKLRLEGEAGSALTTTGFLGTLAYASPEQVEGDPALLDARSDIFSLGVILFEMLTGRNPFAEGPISDVIRSITSDDPPRPSSLTGQRDRGLDAVVLKALAKDPNRRYESAAAMREDLERYLSGVPVEAKAQSTGYVIGRLIRRHRVASTVIGGLATLVVAFSVTMAVLYHRSERESLRFQRVRSFLETALVSLRDPTAPEHARAFYARAMLDQAASRVDLELAGEPAIEAGVRNALAVRFSEIGAWEQVAVQAQRVLAIAGDLPGGGDQERMVAYRLQGRAEMERLNPNAVQCLVKALALSIDHHGETHPLVAELHHLLGVAYWTCSDPPRLEEAAREFRVAIANHAACRVPVSWMAVRALEDYASLLRERGDSDEAIVYYRRTLEMLKALPEGLVSLKRIECLQELGLACLNASRWDEVEAAFRSAIELREGRLTGSVPPCLANIGIAMYQRDRFDEAITWFEQALVARLELLAESHPLRRADFVLLAAEVRNRGLHPPAVPRIWTAISETEPEILSVFQFTTRRMVCAFRELGQLERSAALTEALEKVASS